MAAFLAFRHKKNDEPATTIPPITAGTASNGIAVKIKNAPITNRAATPLTVSKATAVAPVGVRRPGAEAGCATCSELSGARIGNAHDGHATALDETPAPHSGHSTNANLLASALKRYDD